MNVDAFIFKLAILLVPGFFSLHIIKTFANIPLSERRTLSTYDLFLILLLSLISTAILDLFWKIPCFRTNFSMFNWVVNFNGLVDNSFTVWKFLGLIVINLVLGVLIVAIDKCHLWYRILSKIKVSDTFGREDYWCNFLSNMTKNEWIEVRDFSKNYLYIGSVYMASDTLEKRELVLMPAKVYTLTGKCELVFETKCLYLPLDEGNFTMEIHPPKNVN